MPWGLLARLIVTLALLVWATVDLVVNPEPSDHPTALTIIGACIGYWLGQAEHSLPNGVNRP